MGLVAGLQPGDPREIGPYRILGRLGTGGMGQVFLGMSAGGRPIAVKVIRAELADDPQFRARFRGEVAAARKVSGLFTAIVADADLDGPMPWLATAYVAGPSLTEAVQDHGPLPARTLLALAAGLAESLSAIHAAGVVHRDLKPSNVLLAEDGPRVIDFGISQAAEASALTGADVVIGSPGFMSPEQVLGQDIGTPSDLFSLGAVLAYAGTGQGPFGSGSNAALVYRLVNCPANLSLLPAEIRPLVGSCLAKHPGDRPTALELLAVVGAIQPVRGWLSESILYGPAAGQPAAHVLSPAADLAVVPSAADLAVVPSAADLAVVPSAADLAVVPSAAESAVPFAGLLAEPVPGMVAKHVRRRLSRPLTSACITGGLVAASAAVVFALTGAVPRPPAPPAPSQAGAAQTSPAPASHVSVTPSPLSSAHPGAPAANAYMSPALSEFLTRSPAATGLPVRSPAPAKSPGASASPAASASASASASKSSAPSASPSPSPSGSPSASPSPSPSPSVSPSPSPTVSASPSDSGTASPPASGSATSSPASS
ncbi:MAG: serine/threonine protein kinase [Actinomycetota bacterium]|nr:serine/threonine protein kinase [Actinomycetota bacterium]